MQYKTTSEQEMIDLGTKISSQLQGGDVLLLDGELGTGKTTITKGIAKGLDIQQTITSPTFTLMNVYEIPNNEKIKNLVHIDTYRLENEKQLIEIGVEDYLGDEDTLCIVEWPEKMKSLLENKKTIEITIVHDGEGRIVEVTT